MTFEHAAIGKVRVSGREWIPLFMWGVGCLGVALDYLHTGQLWSAIALLVLSGIGTVGALTLRTRGVDLTPKSADVRGALRGPHGPSRRTVLWSDVQAVAQHRHSGRSSVQLVLESGEQVNLLAPTTRWGFGRAKYKRDFDRIAQWWLTYRGESWSRVLPQAQPPPKT